LENCGSSHQSIDRSPPSSSDRREALAQSPPGELGGGTRDFGPPGTGTHEPPSSSSKNRELEEPPSSSSRVALLGNSGTHTGDRETDRGWQDAGNITYKRRRFVCFLGVLAGWLAGWLWALEGVKRGSNNKGTGRGTSHGTRIVFAIAEHLTGANFRNAFIFAATYSLDVAKYSNRSANHRLGELALRSLGSLVGLWIFVEQRSFYFRSLNFVFIHIIAFILALSRRLYINHLSACQLSHNVSMQG
jgi:hypothetical protein